MIKHWWKYIELFRFKVVSISQQIHQSLSKINSDQTCLQLNRYKKSRCTNCLVLASLSFLSFIFSFVLFFSRVAIIERIFHINIHMSVENLFIPLLSILRIDKNNAHMSKQYLYSTLQIVDSFPSIKPTKCNG